MTIEEQLKKEILSKYRSIRAFTTMIDIPYSTLDSVFKRGISNAGVSTMLKVFNAVDLDIESIATGTLYPKKQGNGNSPSADNSTPGDSLVEQIMDCVQQMTPEQQRAILASFQGLLEQDQEP